MSGDTRAEMFPTFERLSYFHGQLLGARDFRTEQAYFRNKTKLLTRCLHGYGVVCGLVVEPAGGPEDCEPADSGRRDELERQLRELEDTRAEIEDRLQEAGEDSDAAADLKMQLAAVEAKAEAIRRQLEELPDDQPDGDGDGDGGGEPAIRITAGLGVDCRGNLLVLGHDLELNLHHALSKADRRRLEEGEAEGLWVSICYCEEAIEPTRPVVTHSCAASEDCTHARVRESVEIKVTVDRPPDDTSCESCCCECDADCDAGCLVLAHMTPVPSGKVEAGSVHNEVRRMLSRHPLTTIVGVNWWQGATYGTQEATDLAINGFEVEFSREVRTDTLRRGVVEVLVYEGGKGNVGDIHYVTGGLELPGTPLTKRLVWKSESDETFQNGDRVIFKLRGDFVLDECCQPIDAENVGGRVPPLPDAVEPRYDEPFEDCISPPTRPGPWTSGDGHPGGTFESWFYVEKDAGEAK